MEEIHTIGNGTAPFDRPPDMYVLPYHIAIGADGRVWIAGGLLGVTHGDIENGRSRFQHWYRLDQTQPAAWLYHGD